MENSEISEICLLSNSDSRYKSRLKNDENMNWEKNRKVPIWFQTNKKKISEISEFLILPYTQDQKLGNLGNFVYLEYWHWFKNVKEMNWDKN